MSKKQIREGINIVLIGQFSPAIFQPAWLASEDLIRQEEASSAEIAVIHQDITVFSTNWFHLEVLQQRVTLSTTTNGYYQPLRDLAIGIFSILDSTPISIFGFNKHYHFALQSQEEYLSYMEQLSPSSVPWDDMLEAPKFQSVSMQGKQPNSHHESHVRITVEQSNRVSNGVAVSINEQFSLPKQGEVYDATAFLQTISHTWKPFLQMSKDVTTRFEELLRRS